MDDNELMARLKQGDTDALALLIRRHRPWALARAEGMLHDAALAEDVVLGFAVELDCIFKLKQKIQQMSKQMVDISETTRK